MQTMMTSVDSEVVPAGNPLNQKTQLKMITIVISGTIAQRTASIRAGQITRLGKDGLIREQYLNIRGILNSLSMTGLENFAQ